METEPVPIADNKEAEVNLAGNSPQQTPPQMGNNKKNYLYILIVFILFLALVSGGYILTKTTEPIKQDSPQSPKSIGCSFKGKLYKPDELFASVDGCNSCSCSEGGFVSCTAMACEKSIENNSIGIVDNKCDPSIRSELTETYTGNVYIFKYPKKAKFNKEESYTGPDDEVHWGGQYGYSQFSEDIKCFLNREVDNYENNKGYEIKFNVIKFYNSESASKLIEYFYDGAKSNCGNPTMASIQKAEILFKNKTAYQLQVDGCINTIDTIDTLIDLNEDETLWIMQNHFGDQQKRKLYRQHTDYILSSLVFK